MDKVSNLSSAPPHGKKLEFKNSLFVEENIMLVLNIEDDVFKHYNICRALRGGGLSDLHIECKSNLEAGIEKIEEQNSLGKPYDLIITDMWYPESNGGREAESGERLITIVQEKGWNIPIILCSSVNYNYPGILGSVHYSENEDWENKLVQLAKKVML